MTAKSAGDRLTLRSENKEALENEDESYEPKQAESIYLFFVKGLVHHYSFCNCPRPVLCD